MEILNKEPIIYIISGKARHGKDTIADFIKSYYEKVGKKALITKYGDDIKIFAKKVSNWDGAEETKPRELLQQLGTDIVRRNIDDLFWINRLCENIKVYSFFFDIIIISDARFPNEIDIPKAYFKKVKSINVFRPDFDNGLTKEQQNHPSELGLDNYDNYDYKIINEGNTHELEEEVIAIIKEVEHEY